MKCALVLLAGCYPVTDPPELPIDPAMFFRLEESGDGPRIDNVHDVELFPWHRLGPGAYQLDGAGTTAANGVIGAGQHIAGADGYHFASRSLPAMDHGSDGFTWAGWASIDPDTGYVDDQTLVAKWTAVPDTDVPGDLREYRVWFDPAIARWRFEVSADGLEGADHAIAVTHPMEIVRGRMYFVEAWHDAPRGAIGLRVSDRIVRGEVERTGWEFGVLAADADLDVGAQNACASAHLQGTIDALGYWTRVLSDTESAALWNHGSGSEL